MSVILRAAEDLLTWSGRAEQLALDALHSPLSDPVDPAQSITSLEH